MSTRPRAVLAVFGVPAGRRCHRHYALSDGSRLTSDGSRVLSDGWWGISDGRALLEVAGSLLGHFQERLLGCQIRFELGYRGGVFPVSGRAQIAFDTFD